MDRLISFLVLLPFLIYFIVPVFMLITYYLKKGSLSKRFVKIWSVGFSSLAVISTFILMVISAQADLAFNGGKIYLTESLTQLSLASQLFGLFAIGSIFKEINEGEWFQKIVRTMFSLGVLTYLIFSNQFLSVFLGLIALLILAPTIKMMTKKILSGIIFCLSIFFYFLSLEFSMSFSEIRLSLLSGEVNQETSLALVFITLIFMLLVTLSVVVKEKKLDFSDKVSWLLLSPVALIICFYRLIQLGFISSESITYNFSQWFLVFYLILFVALVCLKRFSFTGLIFSCAAVHSIIAMLFALSGAEDFNFSFASVHYYAVVSAIFLIALHFINKVELIKRADLDLQDVQLFSSSKSSPTFIIGALVLFLCALPPGPLFLVTFSGVKSLIEVGLYWTTLWSLIALIVQGYFLYSAILTSTKVSDLEKTELLSLWQKKTEESLGADFKEVVFIIACVIAIYVVAFLNL